MSGGRHNGLGAIEAKVSMRRLAVAHVGKAHVLDVFCGPVGVMWDHAYRNVASYVGIDRDWLFRADNRRRYVGDALTILRGIDLDRFNVIDVDAFGEPWKVMRIILARKNFFGPTSIVLTSSLQKSKFGISGVMSNMLGLQRLGGGQASAEFMHRGAIRHMINKTGLVLSRHVQASSNGSNKGSMPMMYDAILLSPPTQPSEVEPARHA